MSKEEVEAKESGWGWSAISSAFAAKGKKATLGDDNTMYFDEKLNRWVDPSAPQDATASAALAPPPTASSAPESAAADPASTVGSASALVPPSRNEAASGTGDLMAAPGLRKKRNTTRRAHSPPVPSIALLMAAYALPVAQLEQPCHR